MNKYSNFTALAQELVCASSSLLGNRTINIMDMDGIIIASSEKSRIGSFHAGALYVIKSGQELAITQENVSCYPGAKEGYNMPLTCNDEVIGVIGIYGVPSAVQDLAKLLKVYAAKYFEMEINMQQAFQNTTLKHSLFQLLSENYSVEQEQKICFLIEDLKVKIHFPIVILCFSKPNQSLTRNSDVWILELLEEHLLKHNMILAKQDIWGFEENIFILLKNIGTENLSDYTERLSHLLSELNFPVKTSISTPVENWKDLTISYTETLWMQKYMKNIFQDLSNDCTRLDYILAESAMHYGKFLDIFIKQLHKNFKGDELTLFLESIESYYRNQKSVTKAAEELYIHKNTLQYRVKKVLEAIGIEHMPPFYQEYLMKLLIQRIQLNH